MTAPESPRRQALEITPAIQAQMDHIDDLRQSIIATAKQDAGGNPSLAYDLAESVAHEHGFSERESHNIGVEAMA